MFILYILTSRMDPKQIQLEISKNIIREGPLKKRSKFLKQWRDRWVVLTSNFMFTFTDQNMKEVTDILEIKQIEGLKSYLKNSDDITPNGFKVQSSQNTLILMASSLEQKWSWLVIVQRLVDFKILKTTGECKRINDVSKLGFKSYNQYMQQKSAEKIDKEQQQKIQEIKRLQQNKAFKQIMKLIDLFKSQEQQNFVLNEQISKNFQQLEDQYPNSKDIKPLKDKLKEKSDYTNDLQIEGIFKGILISKRLEKQNKQIMNNVIKQLLKDCKSEKVLNWGEHIKE